MLKNFPRYSIAAEQPRSRKPQKLASASSWNGQVPKSPLPQRRIVKALCLILLAHLRLSLKARISPSVSLA